MLSSVLAALGLAQIAYTFPKARSSCISRLGLGYNMAFAPEFSGKLGWTGALGCLYHF